MDKRLKQLSYSSILSLHRCPREYQLYKLKSKATDSDLDPNNSQSVTFATGHTIGLGVAEVMAKVPEDEIIWHMFLTWEPDLLAENTKQKKSFWLCIIAMQKLIAMREQGFLKNWEVVTYENKPAIELSFIIHFPDSFVYRGFVDCVLRNSITGAVMVLECKTSSAGELSAAEYKNSAQAIGYSIILDAIFPDISTYSVQYLVYRTRHLEFQDMQFNKSYLSRALWIKELLLDIEMIRMYEASEIFPSHGESCRRYGRDCEYFGLCGMSNTYLTTEYTKEIEEKISEEHSKFQISVSLEDLISAQLNKEKEK